MSGRPVKVYRYCWLNVPAGSRGWRDIVCLSELDFLRELSRWNGSQPGTWQYWPDPGVAARPVTDQERSRIRRGLDLEASQ